MSKNELIKVEYNKSPVVIMGFLDTLNISEYALDTKNGNKNHNIPFVFKELQKFI